MPRSLAGGRRGGSGLLGGATASGAAVEACALPDRCSTTRPADPPRVFDELTKTYHDVAATVVYLPPVGGAGNCRIGPVPPIPRGMQRTVADQSVTVRRWLLTIPLDAPHHIVGDTVTVERSGDPGLVGRYVVVEVDQSSTATARRLLLEHPTGESPRDQ
jgi:hypothetical protein